MSETLIGEPVFGERGNRRSNAANANWKIDTEGAHRYRILPPFGMLANAGRWSFYEAIHWGFKLSNGKMRPFRCIQRKNRKGMVEQECPQCLKIKEQLDLREKRDTDLVKLGRTEEERREILKPLDVWLKTYNLEKVHFMNVLREDNQMGRLKVKIRAKQALDLAFKTLMEREGINPVSVKQGVWVDFVRTGKGRNDTQYTIEIAKEEVMYNGKKLFAIKEAPLSQEIITRMATEAFELATYYKDLSYDQIQMLVQSGGDPEIVDSIFGAPATEKTESVDSSSYFEEETDESVSAEPTSRAKTEVTEESLMAQLSELKRKSSKQPSASMTSASSEPTIEDFIKTFNSGKL